MEVFVFIFLCVMDIPGVEVTVTTACRFMGLGDIAMWICHVDALANIIRIAVEWVVTRNAGDGIVVAEVLLSKPHYQKQNLAFKNTTKPVGGSSIR
jgi:hypothetical protein